MDMEKRVRADFTKEMVEVLETAWNEGMTSAGSKCAQKIQEVATVLGISTERVSIWIGNKRAKEKRAENGNIVPKKKKTTTSGPNAYSYFVGTMERGEMDGSTFLKNASEKWRGMDEEQKKIYFEESREIRSNPLKGKTRKDIISIHMNQIENSVNALSSYGYDVFGMGYDLNGECEPTEFGTAVGIQFADVQLQQRFRTFLTGKALTEENGPQHQPDEKKQLRAEVRNHFNKAWNAATGSGKPVPYQDLREGKSRYEVVGLPDGVGINDPSSYGKPTMKLILQSHVKFQIRNEVPVQSHSIENSEENKQKKLKRKIEKGKTKIQIKKRLTEAKPATNTIEFMNTEDILDSIVSDTTVLETVEDSTEGLENNGAPAIPIDMVENITEMLNIGEPEPTEICLSEQDKDIHQNASQKVKAKRQIKEKKKKGKSTLGNKKYDIEYLVSDREGASGPEFLVKWKDYPDTEQSWEPVSSLPSTALSFYYKTKFDQK